MREFGFRTADESVSLVDTRDGSSGRVRYLDYDDPTTRVVAYVSVATDQNCEVADLTMPAVREMRDWCDALIKDIQESPGGVYSLFIKTEVEPS